MKIVKANPLTKEEVKRLEELLLKDELSLETWRFLPLSFGHSLGLNEYVEAALLLAFAEVGLCEIFIFS
ncbi:MAG: hypothetical protein ABWK05_08695 [Pyrobaculum sp.]